MNNLSRQAGLIVFLAAAVTTTSMAEQPSECTDGENYSTKWLPVLTILLAVVIMCPHVELPPASAYQTSAQALMML